MVDAKHDWMLLVNNSTEQAEEKASLGGRQVGKYAAIRTYRARVPDHPTH